MDTKAIQVNENVEIGRIEHAERTFDALGYTRTEEGLTAYLGKYGDLTKWDGTVIGRYYISATWRTAGSYVSSTTSQVYATLADGTKWTGRSAGEGMVFNGKRVKE